MWRFRPRAQPGPVPAQCIEFSEFKWTLVWMIGHLALSLLLATVYGERRSRSAVMGGTGKADAKASRIRDLVAYNILTLFYQSYVAYLGTQAWFGGHADTINGSPHDRLYASTDVTRILFIATASFELYNTLAVRLLAEYDTYEFIGHHAITLLISATGFHPFLHYYGIFFIGVAAISSVPLALIELANICFPSLTEPLQIAFCATFVPFRTCYWPLVSYHFWLDIIEALQADTVHSIPAAAIFMLANIGLTLLQWFWSTKIAAGVADKLRSGKSHDLSKDV